MIGHAADRSLNGPGGPPSAGAIFEGATSSVVLDKIFQPSRDIFVSVSVLLRQLASEISGYIPRPAFGGVESDYARTGLLY